MMTSAKVEFHIVPTPNAWQWYVYRGQDVLGAGDEPSAGKAKNAIALCLFEYVTKMELNE